MKKLVPVALLLFGCLMAPAATLERLSLDQMSQNATSIVRARVTGSYANLNNSTIYTHYKLQVLETWKGIAASEVMLPGGVANGYRQSFPGVPDLSADTEYVLFLWKSPATGIVHVLGLTQGVFRVRPQTDGSVLAVRPKIGEMMLDSAGHKVADNGMSLKIADLRSHLRLPGSPVGLVK